MLFNKFVVKLSMVCIIHGKKNKSAHATANILGIKVNVISFIEVADWNMLTSNPTSRPATSMGAANRMVVLIASKKNPVKNSAVMSFCYAFGFK
jgi:hypothetical protein